VLPFRTNFPGNVTFTPFFLGKFVEIPLGVYPGAINESLEDTVVCLRGTQRRDEEAGDSACGFPQGH